MESGEMCDWSVAVSCTSEILRLVPETVTLSTFISISRSRLLVLPAALIPSS
jgi:hypothetical protein